MQITSTNSSGLLAQQLSLHGTHSREQVQGVGPEPVSRRNEEQEDIASRRVEPDVELKLQRLRDVQFAFASALKTADFLESNYFFDPIY